MRINPHNRTVHPIDCHCGYCTSLSGNPGYVWMYEDEKRRVDLIRKKIINKVIKILEKMKEEK